MSLIKSNLKVPRDRIIKSFLISIFAPIGIFMILGFITEAMFPSLGETSSVGWPESPVIWIVFFALAGYYLAPFPLAVPVIMTFVIASNWDRIRNRLLSQKPPITPTVPKPPFINEEVSKSL